MIVVDTSVWIDYFAGREEAHVRELDRLIADDAGIALTDVVLTEIRCRSSTTTRTSLV